MENARPIMNAVQRDCCVVKLCESLSANGSMIVEYNLGFPIIGS